MDPLTDNIKLYLEEPLTSFILVQTKLKKMEYQCRLSTAHHSRVFCVETDLEQVSKIHTTTERKTRIVVDEVANMNPMFLTFMEGRYNLIYDRKPATTA
jgi:hypothetical protein